MALRVVGAGLGRTGTHSLKVALERLLGGPCYHMIEVFGRPDDVATWHAAARGEQVDFDTLLRDYRAAVDWPASAFYRELADAYPDAVVLLSVRDDAAAWWKSADDTIFAALHRVDRKPPGEDPWRDMIDALFSNTFTEHWSEREEAMAAYEHHNDTVRREIPPERLVEWRAADGWAPICATLGVPVPDEPFPVTNTTAEFRAMSGLDT